VKNINFELPVVTEDKYNKYKPIVYSMLDIMSDIHNVKKQTLIDHLSVCKRHLVDLGVENTGVTDHVLHLYHLKDINEYEIEQTLQFMSNLCK
jgi:hypothetical protein